eukprot:jgi/Mesvir1/25552/Mv01790-RA.1
MDEKRQEEYMAPLPPKITWLINQGDSLHSETQTQQTQQSKIQVVDSAKWKERNHEMHQKESRYYPGHRNKRLTIGIAGYVPWQKIQRSFQYHVATAEARWPHPKPSTNSNLISLGTQYGSNWETSGAGAFSPKKRGESGRSAAGRGAIAARVSSGVSSQTDGASGSDDGSSRRTSCGTESQFQRPVIPPPASRRFESGQTPPVLPAPSATSTSSGKPPKPVADVDVAKWREQDDESLANAVLVGTLPSHVLEKTLGDCERAVKIRRMSVEKRLNTSMAGMPISGFDYNTVLGTCCEMVVGYIQIPLGVAGPLLVDGEEFMIPMATTEGCLVASTNRGCKAITLSGGVSTNVVRDGMTRAPVVRFETVRRACELKQFAESPDNFALLADKFNGTSRFAQLAGLHAAVAGRNVYLRFESTTGDAMGMNMVSKGVNAVLSLLAQLFPDMQVVSISGNYCADKKPTALNWICGRGKSVVAEAIISGDVVRKVLKTTVEDLVSINYVKNLTGSAMAGSVGGFNAHAANLVTALFIATGQDPAQNVESSNCMTLLEAANGGKDLHASVTMPSIEVGTVGGGTILPAQSAALNLLGIRGAHPLLPGQNAAKLARIVAGSVLAGELSLMAALATGDLVKSHMKYNRSAANLSSLPASMATSLSEPSLCSVATQGSCLVNK